MATYKGADGARQFQKDLEESMRRMVANAASGLAITLTDDSPLIYTTLEGTFAGTESDPVIYPNGQTNIVGDFKNSWNTTSNESSATQKKADPSGGDAYADAISFIDEYKLGDAVYVINGAEYAESVCAKYPVVTDNIDTAKQILEASISKAASGNRG